MRTATGHRENVMDLFHRSHPTLLEAAFAVRMLSCVPVTNPFPRATIFPVDIRGALVLVILTPCKSRMLLTVCVLGEAGTTWISARFLRCSWH